MAKRDKLHLLQSSIQTTNLIQRFSAGIFSTFLLVHLSTPIIAAITLSSDAENKASGFMLVGREWYQGGKKEGVVVWGSAGIHVLSGVVGRALKKQERKERRKRSRRTVVEQAKFAQEDELPTISSTSNSIQDDEEDDLLEVNEQQVRQAEKTSSIIDLELESIPSKAPPFSPHQLSGYVLLPFIIHHASLHRILPLQLNLTPFFSYSFVGYSLALTPSYLLRSLSLISYAATASLGLYHAISGIRILLYPTSPKSLKPSYQKKIGTVKGREWQIVYLGLLSTVAVGVTRIVTSTRAEGKILNWLGIKYEKILRHGTGLKMI